MRFDGIPRHAIGVLTLVAGIVFAVGAVAAKDSAPSFQQTIRPLLKQYCSDCHGSDGPEADLDLVAFRSKQDVLDARGVWLKVLQQLKAGHMPPEDADQPTGGERTGLIQWVDQAVNHIDCGGYVSPGRVTLRRLNRHEYRNTVRDLLGVDYQPADEFPADDVGYGFDNIGDVLSLPPVLMEKYLAAAEQISNKALQGKVGAELKHVAALPPAARRPAARRALTRLATHAFRSPATSAEVDRLLQLVQLARDSGDSVETGIQLALQALLVSPHFLFRVERDPPGDARDRTLNDFELATRLSFFLWNSMPDDRLFTLAAKGALRKQGNLEKQVQRMLRDPKSDAFLISFVDQWLQLRNLDDMEFDQQAFRGCDHELLAAMRTETELFFKSIVRENASILRILDADYTFVNKRLAKHYGVGNVKGNTFQRVSLKGTRRGGILTQASILAVTSNPTRTSPVKRGKFVLDNVLGMPPPPPPANVPLLDAKGRKLTGTLRQRTIQHQTDPACAACHKLMDPIGFALENFDAVGRWRTMDEGLPIDASGELPGGEKFVGPAGLMHVLETEKREAFVRCLTEKLLVYALGRGLEYYDQCAVRRIMRALAANDYRFSCLVTEIVRSDPFQKRGRAKLKKGG